MAGTNISRLYSLRTIEALAKGLPSGRLGPDVVQEYGTQAALTVKSTINRRKHRTSFIDEFVRLFNQSEAILFLTRTVYERIGYAQQFDQVVALRLYRNTSEGAFFGMESVCLTFDQKLRCAQEQLHRKEHLFSRHAIERLYDRIRDYEARSSTNRFRHFVNAQLFAAEEYMIDNLDAGNSGTDGAVPVQGGLFLIKNSDHNIAITTFVDDDQLTDEQSKLSRPPQAAVLYRLLSMPWIKLAEEKTAKLRGKRCRVTRYDAWSFGENGLEPVPTDIVSSL